MPTEWITDVLQFWFGLEPRQWWGGGVELDQRIRQNFLRLWEEKRQLPINAFLAETLR